MVYKVNSKIISPGYQLSDFAGNLRARKLNKAQTKQANITGVHYFSVYQQGVVSSTSSFIIYHISSFYFPHNFVPNFPFSPPPPPPTECASVILNCVSVLPGGTLSPLSLLISYMIRFLCFPFLRRRQDTELLFRDDRCRSAGGGTPL